MNMKYIEKVSSEKWSKIYKLAQDFNKLKCWEWMLDSDIFGVKNPTDGKIGYCCIMGRLGRFKGLSVYLGTEGLESYLKICSGKIEAGSFESLLNQKCLMLSYGDINDMEMEDYNNLKYADITFKENEYPIFRNYNTGYLPWFINNNDADFIINVLEQVINVSLRAKESKDFLESEKKAFLVRVKGRKAWTDKYLKPEKISSKTIKPIIDNDLLDSLDIDSFKREGTWNIASANVPTAIRENNERPYYPYIFVMSEKDSTSPIGFEICEYSKIYNRYPSIFIKTMIENKVIPERIIVFQKEIKKLLEPITDKLKIKISLNKNVGKMKLVIEEIINIINSDESEVEEIISQK